MKTTPPKPASKSLTVRASLAQAVIPALAFLIARFMTDISAADAAMLAGALFAILQAIAQVGLRRATGGGFAALLLAGALFVSGCCSHGAALRRAERAVARNKAYEEKAKEEETKALARANGATFRAIALELGGKK